MGLWYFYHKSMYRFCIKFLVSMLNLHHRWMTLYFWVLIVIVLLFVRDLQIIRGDFIHKKMPMLLDSFLHRVFCFYLWLESLIISFYSTFCFLQIFNYLLKNALEKKWKAGVPKNWYFLHCFFVYLDLIPNYKSNFFPLLSIDCMAILYHLNMLS